MHTHSPDSFRAHHQVNMNGKTTKVYVYILLLAIIRFTLYRPYRDGTINQLMLPNMHSKFEIGLTNTKQLHAN